MMSDVCFDHILYLVFCIITVAMKMRSNIWCEHLYYQLSIIFIWKWKAADVWCFTSHSGLVFVGRLFFPHLKQPLGLVLCCQIDHYARRDLKKGLQLFGTEGNVGLTNAWMIVQTDVRLWGRGQGGSMKAFKKTQSSEVWGFLSFLQFDKVPATSQNSHIGRGTSQPIQYWLWCHLARRRVQSVLSPAEIHDIFTALLILTELTFAIGKVSFSPRWTCYIKVERGQRDEWNTAAS